MNKKSNCCQSTFTAKGNTTKHYVCDKDEFKGLVYEALAQQRQEIVGEIEGMIKKEDVFTFSKDDKINNIKQHVKISRLIGYNKAISDILNKLKNGKSNNPQM